MKPARVESGHHGLICRTRRGAWIETTRQEINLYWNTSRTPRRGAWIETKDGGYHSSSCLVAPAGVRIENGLRCYSRRTRLRRTPSAGVRGLKLQISTHALRAGHVSHPAGVRGLKHRLAPIRPSALESHLSQGVRGLKPSTVLKTATQAESRPAGVVD